MAPVAALLEVITKATGSLRGALAGVEPAACHPSDAARLFDALARLALVVEGATVLFAKQAADSGRWIDEGDSSPATWVAKTTRSSARDAKDVLDTSARLEGLFATAEALRSGELSAARAKEVTLGAKKDPGAEEELLGLAREGGEARLKERVRQILAESRSADDEQRRQRAIFERRALSSWTGADGAFHLKGQMTVEAGARLLASLQAEAEVVFHEAREDGRRERPEAYRLDALLNLVTGRAHTGLQATAAGDTSGGDTLPVATRARSRSDTVIYLASLEALVRGHVGPGEVAEAAGVGPVDVAAIRRAITDGAQVFGVVRDVRDIAAVVTHNRYIPPALLAALQVRDGGRCVVPGCGARQGLQAHHWPERFADSQVTSLEVLAMICKRHHDLVHHGGFTLSGGHGNWRFTPPEDDGSHPVFSDEPLPASFFAPEPRLFEDTG